MFDETHMKANINRYNGLEYGRAVFCVAIVAWHYRLIGNVSRIGTNVGFNPLDLLNFHFFLLAVPVFVQFSMFLYVLNRKHKKNYFEKRIKYLLELFLFWLVFALFIHDLKGHDIAIFFSSFESVCKMIYYGGYDLYYFIFIIIFTTIACEMFLRYFNDIPKSYIGILFVISLMLILLYPFFNWNFRNPVNFLPYIFSSILLTANNKFLQKKYILSYFILWVTWSAIDWVLIPYYNSNRVSGLIMPDYSRISLVFGSIFMISISLKFRGPVINVVKYISEFSLGIYCLHRTFPQLLLNSFEKLGFHYDFAFLHKVPDSYNFFPFIFALITTFLIVLSLKKVPFILRYV